MTCAKYTRQELNTIAVINGLPVTTSCPSLIQKGILPGAADPLALITNQAYPRSTMADLATHPERVLQFVSGLRANSASSTDIYIVALEGSRETEVFFLKIFQVQSKLDPFDFEIRYYRFITDLYLHKRVRNVIPMVASSRNTTYNSLLGIALNVSADATGEPTAAQVNRNLEWLDVAPDHNEFGDRPSVAEPGAFDVVSPDVGQLRRRKYGYIMTPSVNNQSNVRPFVNGSPVVYEFNTLKDYLVGIGSVLAQARRAKNFDEVSTNIVRDFREYMFQIYFTLAVFSMEGFNQNDLHTGNILFGDYFEGESRDCVYSWLNDQGEPVSVRTSTQFIPRIFDFDRSTRAKHGNPTLRFFSPSWGQTDKFIPKTDHMKLTCGIIRNLREIRESQLIWNFIYPNIIKWLLETTYPNVTDETDIDKVFEQYLEEADPGGCFYSRGNRSLLKDLEHTDSMIADPIDIINSMRKTLDKSNKVDKSKTFNSVYST